MKLDVITFSADVKDKDLSSSTVILIDVLRCTSCIVETLKNNAKEVVVFKEVEDARAFADFLGRENCVLGGERHALPLPGFDVGNSPLQYNYETVHDKSVIMTTTNGAKAISFLSQAKNLIICAHINHSYVAKKALSFGSDILVVCSGTNGEISADDMITAGAVVSDILAADSEILPSDNALISKALYDSYNKHDFNLLKTAHCRHLVNLGEKYIADIEFCFKENIAPVVPFLSGKTRDEKGNIFTL